MRDFGKLRRAVRTRRRVQAVRLEILYEQLGSWCRSERQELVVPEWCRKTWQIRRVPLPPLWSLVWLCPLPSVLDLERPLEAAPRQTGKNKKKMRALSGRVKESRPVLQKKVAH